MWRAEIADAARAASDTGTPAAAVPPRSLDEVRADILAELLLQGNPYTDLALENTANAQSGRAAYFAHLQVTVPVEALAPVRVDANGAGFNGGAAAEAPRPVCELDGYGSISARVARDMLKAPATCTGSMSTQVGTCCGWTGTSRQSRCGTSYGRGIVTAGSPGAPGFP